MSRPGEARGPLVVMHVNGHIEPQGERMKIRTKPAVLAIGALSTLMIAGPSSALGSRVPDPIPALIAKGDVTVSLSTVASGLLNPVASAVAPGDDEHLYVAELNGKIWSVAVGDEHGAGKARLVGDIGPTILPQGCFGLNYDERGLLGLAFSPDFRHNGLLYTYSAQTSKGFPDLAPNQCNNADRVGHDHDNVVTEWRINKPRSSKGTVDPSSAREVLRDSHPQFNHNGGELRFGPDGMLYISIGDGGAADDEGPGHAPGGNGQSLATIEGKILRINPMAGNGTPYQIPMDNPFASAGGDVRGEIWAYGFRNPYKMSFDRKTGDLYVADVGQNDLEEVDVVTSGGNYGWPVKEGTFAFDNNGPAGNGFVTADAVSGNFIDPIAEYDHCKGPVSPTLVGPCPLAEGVATVGGFVYRGDAIEELRGHYVFGDYSVDFFSSSGRIFYLDDNHTVTEFNLAGGASLGLGLLGIGEDSEGELYVLGKSGAAFPNTGIVDPANTSGVVQRLTSVDDDHGDGHSGKGRD